MRDLNGKAETREKVNMKGVNLKMTGEGGRGGMEAKKRKRDLSRF